MGLMEVTIKNDIKVTVPDSLNLMTPYVLQEQGDWFEDEIKFLRSYIKPGMKIIDIGANYGAYTLTMAKLVGETGRVWAFEPASATADCLERSIKRNNFNNVKLIRAGLSNKMGKAKLYLSNNAELNSINKGDELQAGSETIQLFTLDFCFNEHKWRNIAFLKLDAEGEESNILKKGKNTLAEISPLIMFELKHGSTFNQPLVLKFNELGYNCYRLLPGLDVIIPFRSSEVFDEYLLNIFSCKEETAEQLSLEGVLVKEWQEVSLSHDSVAEEFINKLGFWSDFKNAELSFKDNEYQQILNMYVMSLANDKTKKERVASLMMAFDRAKVLLTQGEQSSERLSTISRIAFDVGERRYGLEVLEKLINKLYANIEFSVREPFLPACQGYEVISPGNKMQEWFYSSVLEQYITRHAYSCFFTKNNIAPAFETLKKLGFMSDDMQRRHELLKKLLEA